MPQQLAVVQSFQSGRGHGHAPPSADRPHLLQSRLVVRMIARSARLISLVA
jgi:hypothetical protein